MLQFPYQPVPLTGPPPASLLPSATARWRPFAPVTIVGPTGVSRHFKRALVDPGADDTVFPLDIVTKLQVVLRPNTGHGIRWRGQLYPLRYGDVELQLAEGNLLCRWAAVVCFSNAPIPYRILGYAGCLEFFDVRFRGADRLVEIEPNRAYTGTIQ
jgi:hypothetical protein